MKLQAYIGDSSKRSDDDLLFLFCFFNIIISTKVLGKQIANHY